MGLKYDITLDDRATLVYQKFLDELKKGDSEAANAMRQVTAATRERSDASSKLTQWIREERTEQREHNFIFRQGQEVISAVSIGMAAFGTTLGNTSAVMRNATDAMNQGFVVFQGLNNVIGLMGVGGAWGIAIAAIGGIAAAMGQIQSKGAEANKVLETAQERLRQIRFEAGLTTPSSRMDELLADYDKAALKLRELQGLTYDVVQGGTKDYRGQFAPTTTGNAVYRLVGTPEQIVEAKTKLAEVQKEINRLRSTVEPVEAPTLMWELNGAMETVGSTGVKVAIDLDTYWTRFRHTLEGTKSPVDKIMKEFKEFIEDAEKAQKERVRMYSEYIQIGVQGISQGMQAAIAGEGGGFKKFLKSVLTSVIDMVQGLIVAAAAAAWAKSTFLFGTNLPGDIAAIAAATVALQSARAIMGTFHQGGIVGPMGNRVPLGPDERPIIVKVGETVRTREQEARLRGGGMVVNINFNGGVHDARSVKRMVEEGMRATGLTPDKYFTDTSKGFALT